MTILRKITVLFLALTLCFTTVACGGGEQKQVSQTRNVSQNTPATRISDGQYPVQQATFNDADGEYTLFLLNTPAGTPPSYKNKELQMARLTDEQIKAGEKSYLKVENGQPSLYLTPDFKIEYVHNVTETRTNANGQQQTVVVRRENGFWAPFAGSVAGAVAGQAVGNLLFRPRYYVPPLYQPGVSVFNGYGGYGNSYGEAFGNYRTRYNQPSAVEQNRTTFRTTGQIRRPLTSQPDFSTAPRTNSGSRSSGSGFGSSNLRPSGQSGTVQRRPSSSFGSGGRSSAPRRSSSGFGSRRR